MHQTTSVYIHSRCKQLNPMHSSFSNIHRHVFTSSNKVEKHVSKSVQAVLDEYDDKAEALKGEYQKAVTNRSDFREFGWILTDWCHDGFDGKQQTIATYI